MAEEKLEQVTQEKDKYENLYKFSRKLEIKTLQEKYPNPNVSLEVPGYLEGEMDENTILRNAH